MGFTNGGTATDTDTGTGTRDPAPCPFGPELEPSLRASGPVVESEAEGILSGGGRLLLSTPLFGAALIIGELSLVESGLFPFCGLVGERFPVLDGPAGVLESRLPPSNGLSDPDPEIYYARPVS